MSEDCSVSVNSLLSAADVIFWDFDGVIKDSVNVKTEAFTSLFLPYGTEVVTRVKHHHESNGGVSRFEKIPLYLTWAGEPATQVQTKEFCDRFSTLAMHLVIDSPWVAGVHEYLLGNCERQYFVLVTATPQDEIEKILAALDIEHCFREVYGAPTKKNSAIKAVLSIQGYAPAQALMIGDAETDLQAARANSVPFLLRRTPLNLSIQATYPCITFDDLGTR